MKNKKIEQMKYLKIITVLLLPCFLLFMGCEDTNDDLVQERGENVMAVISDLSPANFNEDVANSYISFTVSLPDGESVDAATVEVVLDSLTADLQSITSFPATVTVNAADAVAALGVSIDDITTSSVFYVYVTTEVDGRVTRSKTASLTVPVVCAFDENLTAGSYHEYSSGWAVEGDVTLTADENDPYTITISGLQAVDGLTGNGNDYVITIDPGTFAVTGEGTVIMAADLSEWGYTYTNYAYTLTSGSYDSCEGTYELEFKITVDQGSFGSYSFTFSRN